jgi:hypothetical protein
MGYGNRNFEQKESKSSKWGPPPNSGGGPKSLMDMNFNNGNYRGERPRGPPPNQGGHWNQNRSYGGPRHGGPPRGNAPWQNGPLPPRGNYILSVH